MKNATVLWLSVAVAAAAALAAVVAGTVANQVMSGDAALFDYRYAVGATTLRARSLD